MYKACLVFFQLCGFYPLPLELSNERKKSSILYKIVLFIVTITHFMLTLVHIFHMFIRHNEMLYSESVIGKINDIILYSALLLAHSFSIVETYIERENFEAYWNFYYKVVKLNRKSINTKWYQGYLIKFVVYVLFTVTIEATVITSVTGADEQWERFWYASIYSLIATRIRHIQHVFVIDVIFFTLEGINDYTKCMTFWNMAIGNERKFKRQHFFRKISIFKEQFKNLMEMIIRVNKIFRWSQVLNVGQHFIEITVELYWIYAFTKEETFLFGNLMSIINSFCLAILLFFFRFFFSVQPQQLSFFPALLPF